MERQRNKKNKFKTETLYVSCIIKRQKRVFRNIKKALTNMATLNSNNPNKWVRKAIIEAIDGEYPCFDMQVTGNTNPTQYVIISTQSKRDKQS